MIFDRALYDKTVKEVTEKMKRDPAYPYNVHFYEAKLHGRLRIFDLFRDDAAVTVGESLVGKMEPVKKPAFPPTNASGFYIHVNYGGWPSTSTDWVMSTFAGEVGLTDVIKVSEVHTVNEMGLIMPGLLQRLWSDQ